MLRNIIISIFLIFLFGCKELYFKYPQPRGGKVLNGNIEQMLNSAIPVTVNSDDRNSILNEIINDNFIWMSLYQIRFFINKYDWVNSHVRGIFSFF